MTARSSAASLAPSSPLLLSSTPPLLLSPSGAAYHSLPTAHHELSPLGALFHVLHEDGDEEDLDEGEAIEAVQRAAVLCAEGEGGISGGEEAPSSEAATLCGEATATAAAAEAAAAEEAAAAAAAAAAVEAEAAAEAAAAAAAAAAAEAEAEARAAPACCSPSTPRVGVWAEAIPV